MTFDFTTADTSMFAMFAVAATIGGESIENGVIFDSPHQVYDSGPERFEGRQYQASAITADLEALTTQIIDRVTTIDIAGTTYTVMDQRPDGAGLTMLDLKEA